MALNTHTGGPNVGFGSKADICGAKRHVRFTLNSERKSGHPMVDREASPRRAPPRGGVLSDRKVRRGQTIQHVALATLVWPLGLLRRPITGSTSCGLLPALFF